MVKGLKPNRVPRNTGKNPVAQAVARAVLRQAVTDQKIQLYLLRDGTPCQDILIPMSMLLTAFVMSAERDKNVGADTPEVKILKGALSACDQMITNNSYRQANTTALDVALDCAVTLSSRVNPDLFNAAWNELCGGAG